MGAESDGMRAEVSKRGASTRMQWPVTRLHISLHTSYTSTENKRHALLFFGPGNVHIC